MRHLIQSTLAALVLCLGFSQQACAWDALEDAIYHLSIKAGQLAAHVETKSIAVSPECVMVYYDNNNSTASETLVLLHGFTGDKDNWTIMASYLKQYHLIIPDLGGHGESCYDEKTTYNIPNQVQLLHQFLNKLNIGKVHLAGNSMGGWITTYYTSEYPEEIKSIALFDAGGVVSPVKSPFFQLVDKGENPFFFSDQAGFEKFIKMAMQDPPFLPWPIMKVQTRMMLAHQPRIRKIYAELTGQGENHFAQDQMVDSRLTKIKQPALIIWGKQDHILDISMAEVFANGLSNHETTFLDGVGHVPMLEHPKQSAQIYAEFIEKHK